jgi:hypothetical protein
MTTLLTPISVLEEYFEVRLTQTMAFWKEVAVDRWVDFAKYYLARMKAGFTPESMAARMEDRRIRFYFDRSFGAAYDREITRSYTRTPLLSHSP